MNILEVRQLTVRFQTRGGNVDVIHPLDLDVEEGETIAVVGETGCGKTVLARSIMRLLPRTATVGGSIWWKGTELTALDEEGMRAYRGREIALLLQNPSSALDPTMRVLGQVSEPFRLRLSMGEEEARRRAREALERVGLPADRFNAYPHELSGGMRQRVAIAIALSMEPSLLLADEPTKGLDLTSRDMALGVLRSALGGGRSGVLITHDLEAARSLSSRIAVMFEGRVVEQGKTADVLEDPQHPYTVDLVASMPENGFGRSHQRDRSPSGKGCCYSHRCSSVHDRCCQEPPEVSLGNGQTCCCWLKEGG